VFHETGNKKRIRSKVPEIKDCYQKIDRNHKTRKEENLSARWLIMTRPRRKVCWTGLLKISTFELQGQPSKTLKEEQRTCTKSKD
jgi:hypothetical protein